MAEQRIRERLAGCWRLVSYNVTPVEGGEAERPLGDHPLGTILYTPDGYMSAQLARQGPYDHDDQQPDAYYIAYSGPCTYDDKDGSFSLKVHAAWRPNYVGTDQKRMFHFENGKLIFGTLANSIRSNGETLTRRLTLIRVQ